MTGAEDSVVSKRNITVRSNVRLNANNIELFHTAKYTLHDYEPLCHLLFLA